MKVLIWVLTFFIASALNYFLGIVANFRLGVIPLDLIIFFVARSLCRRWDDTHYQKDRYESDEEEASESDPASDDETVENEIESFYKCGYCGGVTPAVGNCPTCGRSWKVRIDKEPSSGDPVDPSEKEGEGVLSVREMEPEEKKPLMFCRKCGAKLLEDSVFCVKCGTQIIEEVQKG